MTTTTTTTTTPRTAPVVTLRRAAAPATGWVVMLLGSDIATQPTRHDARILAASLKVRTSGLTEDEIRTQWSIPRD